MNKMHAPAWFKTSLFLTALFVSQVYFSAAFAKDDGSITTGGFNLDGSPMTACMNCHTAGATTVMILGPTQVVQHADPDPIEYTLQISGDGPGVVGGLDVATDVGNGILSLITGQGTRENVDTVTGVEITHTEPQAFSSGTAEWTFSWTPVDADGNPLALGTYKIFGQGVNGSGGSPQNVDFAGMTTFSVELVPVPIPAAGLLFGSALGLLAWIRRRVS